MVERYAVFELQIEAADAFFQISPVAFDEEHREDVLVVGLRAPQAGAFQSLLLRFEEGEIGPLDSLLEELGLRIEGITERFQDRLDQVGLGVYLAGKALDLFEACHDVDQSGAGLLFPGKTSETLDKGAGEERVFEENRGHLG